MQRAPKFYLFDVGVAGTITKRHLEDEKGELFGKAFEHFIFMEIAAHNSYNELDYPINFWRTKSGLEVNFVLGGGEVAIEVKGTARVEKRDLLPQVHRLRGYLVHRQDFWLCRPDPYWQYAMSGGQLYFAMPY